MVTEEQIRDSLKGVLVPAVMRSIEGLNMIRDISVSDQRVRVTLASTGLIVGAQDWIKAKTREAIEKLNKVNEIAVEFTEAKPKDLNEIRHIIAVMSGKGVVGKSLVSSLIAIALKQQGYEVGLPIQPEADGGMLLFIPLSTWWFSVCLSSRHMVYFPASQ